MKTEAIRQPGKPDILQRKNLIEIFATTKRIAEKNSRNLAVADMARRKASGKLAKLDAKVKKAGGIENASPRLAKKMEIEEKTEAELQRQFVSALRTAQSHMKEIMSKYGEENVKAISGNSKTGYAGEYPVSTMLKRSAIALGATAASVGLAAFGGVPFVALITPRGPKDDAARAYAIAKQKNMLKK